MWNFFLINCLLSITGNNFLNTKQNIRPTNGEPDNSVSTPLTILLTKFFPKPSNIKAQCFCSTQLTDS